MKWRARYRQVQLVRESSDAGFIVKYILGHTSLLLYRDIYELFLNWKQALSLHNNSCYVDETNGDGWNMHELDYSTSITM